MTRHLLVALSTILLLTCVPGLAHARPNVSSLSIHSFQKKEAVPAADSSDTDPPAQSPALSRSMISVWGAGSVTAGSILGQISEGWVGLLGLRYHRLLIPTANEDLDRHNTATLTYTADLVPLAAVSIPKGTLPDSPSSAIQSVTEIGLSTYGMAVYPIGLRVGFRPSAPLRPFVAGHTGFFYLFDPVPDERGRQLNFAAGVGGGVTISLAPRTTLTLGYRYHHLSNGFRGSINPGLDANLLYVGIGLSP